ncbi:MAG: hypothetical protein K9N09_01945 [Candidatus Cloacimonetes bacterium]|nr:hypothetical protein [Candidatus Cloacimonadota bacterium]MCF7813236.1 hypothetical protein [Candidatus Cloacimonadota bacterium]MCF7867435.1 hypothetical protein [Candidatus Cloacimonadota bacterium]MCF7882933.1 hypothetical protein [Candidatus Cloacimonadota bacterium]
MKKLILLIFIAVLLVSCASKKPEAKPPKVVKKIVQEPLPAWVYQIPAGRDCVIGIASRTIYEDQMKDAAKQMATIVHSRNKASYTIEKAASTDKENYLQGGSAEFKLNVSSSPEETQRIYENLQLLDEAFYYEFYLALFAENGDSLSSLCTTKFIANFPDWYENDGLKVDENGIRCYASESSSNLISAWQRATEEARFELAKYLEKNVQSQLLSKDENITKKIAIETRLKLEEMQVTRSYVTSELKDNLRSYKVYLEMILR